MNSIRLLTCSIVFVMMSYITTNAQVEYNAITNFAPKNIETKSLVILFASDISKRNIRGEMDVESIKAAEELYDRNALKEFGSYMNPYSNQFHVVPNDDVEYSKIQITDKSTGEVIIKRDLNLGKNMLDFTTMKPGTYVLILTDQVNNIYSEEITVI